jgi:hypothetical protein
VVGIYQSALFNGWYLSPAAPGFSSQRMDFADIDVADGFAVAGVRHHVEQLLADTRYLLRGS